MSANPSINASSLVSGKLTISNRALAPETNKFYTNILIYTRFDLPPRNNLIAIGSLAVRMLITSP